MSDTLHDLTREIRAFAEERAWHPFHSPKNLAMALMVEAGELAEIFQWQTQHQSRHPDETTREAAALELADVLIYLCRLADTLGIDPVSAARRKMAINRKRYPVDRSRGRADKYTAWLDDHQA